MSASPAPSTSRSRAKPLRTYGKRSTRDDSPRETNPKKRRTSPEAASTETSVPKNTDIDAGSPSLPKIVAEETKNTAEPTAPGNKPVKKGSILSFFKPIPSSSTAASSPKSDEPQPVSSPPSSPPPRIETRKKPRLLRFRGASLPLLDSENTEDDTQAEKGVDTEEESGAKSTRSAPNESSLIRESSSSSHMKASKKAKGKASAVQTTLNLTSQAAFSECKICNTVWNPLYPDDVKFHTKQHAAVLRAMRKEKENEL